MTTMIIFAFLLAEGADGEYRKGTALLEEGRIAEAIPHLERAARAAKDRAQYWKALGVAFARLEDYRGALEPFGQACRLEPRLTDACYYYGRALYAADRYRDAIEPLQRALRSDEVKARAEAGLGQCYEALGEEARAEEHFRKALARRRDPTRETARLAYARFLVRQGRPEEAVTLLRAPDAGEGAEALHVLGLALYQAERLEEAVAVLERAAQGQQAESAARMLLERARRRLKAR